MKVPIYCSECGRQMVLRPKKVGALSFDTATGERQRFIAGHNYPEEMVKGEFVCPSRLCRLLNYSALTCHTDYYLVGDKILTEYSGD